MQLLLIALHSQNALFMAIIAAGGPINWKNVVLPPGRSQMSCWHVVDHAKKDAASRSFLSFVCLFENLLGAITLKNLLMLQLRDPGMLISNSTIEAGGIEIGDAGSSPAAPAKKSGRPKKVVADGEAGASTKRKRGKKVAEEISPDGENADGYVLHCRSSSIF